ncbi:MAG: glycosyltransferase family 4 protein [Desulfoferrobacter sp.]
MKIAFYCPNKPLSHPLPSGDLTIARGIQQALRTLGHDCREIVAFRSRWFWKSHRGWLQAATSFVSAHRNATRFRPGIWLTYHSYYKSPDVLGPWVSRLLNIPYILFQPMYSTRRRKQKKTRFGFYLNRMALKACRHAFTNNIDDLEALHRILPSRNTTYIPPGIFPEEFQYDEQSRRTIRERYGITQGETLLLTAAMLRADVKFESISYLLRSLALLKQEHGKFMLLLCGDGPMAGEVRSMADSLLPGSVIFAGRVARSEMPAHYSAADIFVFPGIGESLGMVFLEAQACGCPVVALDVAGVPQVVLRNETGLLVPEDGGRAMARAVEKLINDHQLRLGLAANGPEFITTQRNLHRNYTLLSEKLEKLVAIPATCSKYSC